MDRRIPVVTLRFDVLALDRCDADAFAGLFIKADEAAVLALGVDDVRVGRIDLRTKTVAAVGRVPVGIHDAGDVSRTGRAAERIVVLGAAVDVIKRHIVVGDDVVKLGDRQIGFEIPIDPAVIALVDAAVAADE